MSDERAIPKATGNLVVISPKVTDRVMFNYRSIEDLPDLINFVGKAPLIQTDLTLRFKKTEVKAGDFIEVNQYGDVTTVLNEEIINKSFVIKAVKQFTPEYKNKVIPKPPRAKK